MKVVNVVAAALFDADGTVLHAQRPEGKSMAGLWEFPGGKIEEHERPEEALVRELNEELAITVSETDLYPNTFRNCAKRLQRDESGATAIEYGLIMGLMAVALIGAIGATGSSTGDKWEGVANKVGDAMENAGN